MKLWDLFSRRNAATELNPRATATATTYDLTDPALSEFLRGGVPSASGIAITPETALRVSIAYRCVTLLSDHIATIPIDVTRRINSRVFEEAEDHPLWYLLNIAPNGWQTATEFRKLMQAAVLLRGNGYALIVRQNGLVKSLVPLTGTMEITQNNDLSLSYKYTSSSSGTATTIPQEDVFHLRGMSLDGLRGISVISHARETLGLALTMERHANKLFRNRTASGGVLSHPNRIEDPQFERLKTSLEDFRGSDSERSYADLILEEGMEYKPFGLTSVDAQFVQQQQMSASAIATFFGIPPHRVGLTTRQTSFGTGIEQQNISFVQDTLVPHTMVWEDAAKRDLIEVSEPKLFVRFNFTSLMRGDHAARSQYYNVMFNTAAMSPNDIRASEGMNPREGGDEYTIGGLGGAGGDQGGATGGAKS